jgi:hypothetical protein
MMPLPTLPTLPPLIPDCRSTAGDGGADCCRVPLEVTHDEAISYTRDDVILARAETLGTSPDDRIVDVYDQIVSEWSLLAEDPEIEYARFFQDGLVATRIDLVAATEWAKGEFFSRPEAGRRRRFKVSLKSPADTSGMSSPGRLESASL